MESSIGFRLNWPIKLSKCVCLFSLSFTFCLNYTHWWSDKVSSSSINYDQLNWKEKKNPNRNVKLDVTFNVLFCCSFSCLMVDLHVTRCVIPCCWFLFLCLVFFREKKSFIFIQQSFGPWENDIRWNKTKLLSFFANKAKYFTNAHNESVAHVMLSNYSYSIFFWLTIEIRIEFNWIGLEEYMVLVWLVGWLIRCVYVLNLVDFYIKSKAWLNSNMPASLYFMSFSCFLVNTMFNARTKKKI